MTRTLLFLGFGFSARAIARELTPRGWRMIGTTRRAEGCEAIATQGVTPQVWPGGDLGPALGEATHIVSSVPPRDGHDPALEVLRAADLPRLEWLGLLSTTGVYGDHQGEWVDEDTPLAGTEHRHRQRVWQNGEWMRLHEERGLPVHIFRLAGIYGPGRSPFDKLRDGTAHRIVKEGQVFSRIHAEDIAQTVAASMDRPNPGRAYNLADDEPAPPWQVTEHAARLLGIEPPPIVPFDKADLSPMARSFWADNKRVRNDRIKRELGVSLRHPTYREGLDAVLAAGG